MNGKLEIVIKKSDTGENLFVTREKKTPSKKEPGEQTKESQLLNPLITQYAKQLMNEGISVYGNVTGNTIQVNKINNFLNLTADAVLAATGVVGLVAVGFKYTTQIINQQIEYQKAYDKSQFLQSGMGKIVNNYGRYN